MFTLTLPLTLTLTLTLGALSFQLELPGLRPEDLRVVVQVRALGLG